MVTGPGTAARAATATFGAVIAQIMLLDIVFSLDSIITAVGMVEQRWVMVTAILAFLVLQNGYGLHGEIVVIDIFLVDVRIKTATRGEKVADRNTPKGKGNQDCQGNEPDGIAMNFHRFR